MQVTLQAVTQPVNPEISPADFIAYVARVSNPSNQNNHLTAPKLLAYLVKHKHWSPFEMVNVVMEIETTRDIGRQILRHRSFSFQEFCITGDSLITLELPRSDKGSRFAYKRTIEHLYKLQKSGRLPKYVRVFDENTQTFVRASIREVFETGIKPVYKVTLANGKTITTTKEHKFLTQEGFMPLENAVGLEHLGSKAVCTRQGVSFACNGTPVYQSYEWMYQAKERALINKSGVTGIAEEAGVSYHTIRKWLRKHKLQFSKAEAISYTNIWNRGKYGYRLKPHSMETIEKMRKSAKRGAESNLWKGGVSREERQRVADWAAAHRKEFLHSANYCCGLCGSNERLELHHIVPVSSDITLAYEKSNIQVLCSKCHRTHHNLAGHPKTWRKRSKGRTLTLEWSEVISVEYVGEMQTYDMEVDHVSHNYVANGIVTHNSGRYADPTKALGFEVREARLQDLKNRQNSIEMGSTAEETFIKQTWYELQERLANQTQSMYEWALQHGIAKELARAILPEGMIKSRMYVNGTLRSWIHFCLVRMGPETQKEHREIAASCWKIILEQFPALTIVEVANA